MRADMFDDLNDTGKRRSFHIWNEAATTLELANIAKSSEYTQITQQRMHVHEDIVFNKKLISIYGRKRNTTRTKVLVVK